MYWIKYYIYTTIVLYKIMEMFIVYTHVQMFVYVGPELGTSLESSIKWVGL